MAEERGIPQQKLNTQCWNWMGSKTKKGYGIVILNEKMFYTHRIMCRLTNSEFKEEELVCHACDNPSCINPKHLWLGSHKDNMKDWSKKNKLNQKYPKHSLRDEGWGWRVEGKYY